VRGIAVEGPVVPVPPETVGRGAAGGSLIVAVAVAVAAAVAVAVAVAVPVVPACGAAPPEAVVVAVGAADAPEDGVAVGVVDAIAEPDVVGDAVAEVVVVADPLGPPGAARSELFSPARTITVIRPTVTMSASAMRMTSRDVAPREDCTRTVDPFRTPGSKIIEP
jgi:hypothetical protein